jgi:hypothetical protein
MQETWQSLRHAKDSSSSQQTGRDTKLHRQSHGVSTTGGICRKQEEGE